MEGTAKIRLEEEKSMYRVVYVHHFIMDLRGVLELYIWHLQQWRIQLPIGAKNLLNKITL